MQRGPDNLTPKQEKFVREFIAKGDMTAAYRGAYDTKGMKPATVNRKAFELGVEHVGVAARIRQEQKRIKEACEVTVEGLMAELEEVREMAMHLEQPAPAATAIMAKAKLAGLAVDKTENRTEITDHREEKPDFAQALDKGLKVVSS